MIKSFDIIHNKGDPQQLEIKTLQATLQNLHFLKYGLES